MCDFNSFLLDFIFILRLPYFNPRRVLLLLSNPDSRKCLEIISALLGHQIITNHNVCKASAQHLAQSTCSTNSGFRCYLSLSLAQLSLAESTGIKKKNNQKTFTKY